MPAVVITGVSTGIGRAMCGRLCAAGFRVFGSVRSEETGRKLEDELGPAFTALQFDVTDDEAVHAAARQVSEAIGSQRLAGLVNNAGVAVAGPMSHLPVAEFQRQLEINVVGPMRVTQAFLPLLGTDPNRKGKPGRIIMISSVGGKIGAPFLAPYVASKHAIEGMSESLRRELMFYGIDVVVVAPGHVATPIWDKAEQMDISPYADLPVTPYMEKFRNFFIEEGKKGFPPEKIAETVYQALTKAKPKTRYAIVPGHFANWVMPRLLPSRTVDGVIAKRLGLPKR